MGTAKHKRETIDRKKKWEERRQFFKESKQGLLGIGKVLAVIGAILLSSSVIGWLDNDGWDKLFPESQQDKEKRYIVQGQSIIQSMLKDPGSAMFKNLAVVYKDGVPYVCGSVNARNSFGGYVGYNLFVSGGKLHVILDGKESDNTLFEVIDICNPKNIAP
jgi:hypothetical protein